MKKLIVVALLLVFGFTVAGCGSQAGRIDGDTDGFSREIITISGDQFDCIFHHKNQDSESMSCTPAQK